MDVLEHLHSGQEGYPRRAEDAISTGKEEMRVVLSAGQDEKRVVSTGQEEVETTMSAI
jgi:hypothetical protein